MPPPGDGPLRIAYLSYRGKPHVGGQGVYTRHLTKAWSTSAITSRSSAASPTRCSTTACRSSSFRASTSSTTTYPGRFPRLLGVQALARPGRDRPVLDRPVQRAAGVQPAGMALPRARASRLRPRPRQPVPRLRHLGDRPAPPGARDAAPPDHDGPDLEVAHAPNRRKRRSVSRWYGVREDAGAGRAPACRAIVIVSENSINDIHTRLRRAPRPHAPRAGRRRPRAVPAPRPDIARVPGRLITTASADVALEGSRPPARSGGQAAHRTRRPHAHGDRPAQARRPQCRGDRAPRPRRTRSRSSAACPTSASSSSTPRPSSLSCPRCTRASRCRPSRRWPRGIALVATTGGALPEVIGTDGETVLLVPPGDADALAATHPARPRRPRPAGRIGAAGRERVISRWSWRHGRGRPSSSTASSSSMRAARRAHEPDADRRLRRSSAYAPATGCSTSAAASAATRSRPPPRRPRRRRRHDRRRAQGGARHVRGDGRGRPSRRRRRCTGAVNGDALRLPFTDGAFDRVIAAEVLEHIPDDAGAMAELARVLRPGGTIAVTVPAWLPEKVCWAAHRRVPRPVRRGRPRPHLHARRDCEPSCAPPASTPARRTTPTRCTRPYWWLRCAVGPTNDTTNPLVRLPPVPGVGHRRRRP